MRRLLLILLAILLGSTGLLALYVAWDYDPDRTIAEVDVPSYSALFEAAVQRSMKKPYAGLDERSKTKVLGDLIGPRHPEPVREVALHHIRELRDSAAALTMIRKQIKDLPPDLFEVAVGSLASLRYSRARTYLDSLHRTLDADPAAHTPLGGYRTSSFILADTGVDITMSFEEQSRLAADYRASRAIESTIFFPRGAEYMIGVPNVDDVIERFEGSRFATTLKQSPVAEDAWTLPLLRSIASLRSRLGESMGFMADLFSPERLFRDALIIGKYDEEYLLVSFKDKNVTVAETMVGIFEALGSDFGIRRWSVEGTTISTVRSKHTGRSVSYATLGDYFIVSTDTALITRSIKTFRVDRARSIAIDPLFQRAYRGLDQTGRAQAFFAWLDPTRYFDITGSTSPAARRLAVVSRALGRPIVEMSQSSISDLPGMIGSTSLGGIDPNDFWRYVVDVRSLGKNPVDSLARLARIDVGRQIIAYLAPTMEIAYGGVEHLKRPYGYSNTGFNIVSIFPLRNAPASFDATIQTFFGRITSLVYTADSVPNMPGVRLWVARDTSTNDSVLQARKLQPSFTVLPDRLLVASTPELLRRAVIDLRAGQTVPADRRDSIYFTGALRVDSLAANTTSYLRAYLMRTDRFAPEEIDGRLGPLRDALALYSRVDWRFFVKDGLRHGTGRLIARK